MVGLDLSGLFQPELFYDSMIIKSVLCNTIIGFLHLLGLKEISLQIQVINWVLKLIKTQEKLAKVFSLLPG